MNSAKNNKKTALYYNYLRLKNPRFPSDVEAEGKPTLWRNFLSICGFQATICLIAAQDDRTSAQAGRPQLQKGQTQGEYISPHQKPKYAEAL